MRDPLWVAQYPDHKPTGYMDKPWTDSKGYGAWKSPAIFQYTGTGRLDGYNGNLDLDKAFISGEEWLSYARSSETSKPIFEIKLLCNLNIRSDAGVENPIAGLLTDTYKIIDTKKASDGGTWGQLETGGWINISSKFVKRVI